MTVRVRFEGAAKGAIEKVEIEIASVVATGGQPLRIQPVLVGTADRLWLTIGAAPEGNCSLAREAWRFEEVEPQWDRLILRTTIEGEAHREFALAELGQPRGLIVHSTGSKRLGVGVALFCGLPAPADPPRPGQTIEAVLDDPVLARRVTHSYRL